MNINLVVAAFANRLKIAGRIKLLRIVLLFFVITTLLFSCTKDEEDYPSPEADFTWSEEIDRFVLTSTSVDPDNEPLTYQWQTESELITIQNATSKTASFLLPQLEEPVEVLIEHIVCNDYACDDVSKTIQLPVLTEIRLWGLGYNLDLEFNNNVDYEWYMDQLNTGTYSYVNCGPTSVTMAIKWTNEAFDKTPEDARNTYRPSGGWWYTNDIINYLNDYSVSNVTIAISESDVLINELEEGNTIILCLDMYYIEESNRDEWRIDRFYPVSGPEWGHFIVLKGYKIVDGQVWYEVYDPYSLGVCYSDQTLKGKDRYYRSEDIDQATNNWWDNAIVVSKNKIQRSDGLQVDEIEHKRGI